MKEDEFFLTVTCWQGWEQVSKTMVDAASGLLYLHNSLYYFHSHSGTCVSVWQAHGTCLDCMQGELEVREAALSQRLTSTEA